MSFDLQEMSLEELQGVLDGLDEGDDRADAVKAEIWERIERMKQAGQLVSEVTREGVTMKVTHITLGEWSISTKGHLTIRIQGPHGMSAPRTRVYGTAEVKSAVPSPAVCGRQNPNASWKWRAVDADLEPVDPDGTVTIQGTDADDLNQLVLAHPILGRIADCFGIDAGTTITARGATGEVIYHSVTPPPDLAEASAALTDATRAAAERAHQQLIGATDPVAGAE